MPKRVVEALSLISPEVKDQPRSYCMAYLHSCIMLTVLFHCNGDGTLNYSGINITFRSLAPEFVQRSEAQAEIQVSLGSSLSCMC